MNRRLPTKHARAVDLDVQPEPDGLGRAGRDRRVDPVLAREPGDGARDGMIEAPLGGGGQPDEIALGPARGGMRTTRAMRGVPDVSVPVLSKTTVSTRARFSSADGPLIRMPARDARLIEVRIAVGMPTRAARP